MYEFSRSMAVQRRRWQVWWNLWKACEGDKERAAAVAAAPAPATDIEVELGIVVVVVGAVEADTGGTDLDLESNR